MRNKPLILIVDDDDSFIEIMSTKLKATGYEVIFAKNEGDARRSAEEFLPDLILMDIHIPLAPSGTDIALAIKQNPKTKDVKIAFLTSLKDPWPGIAGDNKTVSQELGMADFLEKSDDLNHLMERVKEILAR